MIYNTDISIWKRQPYDKVMVIDAHVWHDKEKYVARFRDNKIAMATLIACGYKLKGEKNVDGTKGYLFETV